MAIRQRQLTLEEFLRLPERKPALEYVDGVITQKGSPKHRHGRLQSKFATLVNSFAEPLRLAVAFTGTRSVFGGSSPVPDVMVYRWDRLPLDDDGELLEDNFEPPDIAVEILSPGQSAAAQNRRCAWYVEHGVPIALSVNPRDRSVTMFRPGLPPRAPRGTDRIDLDDVLPGFELTVQELFDSLRFR